VPLRENLDPESRLNRLLARQTYEKERADKVKKDKEELEIKFEKDLEDYNKKKAKEEKKREKEMAKLALIRKDDLVKVEEKRKAAYDTYKSNNDQRLKDMEFEFKKKQRQEKAAKEKKEIERIQKEKA